jgi:hypothetical protein
MGSGSSGISDELAEGGADAPGGALVLLGMPSATSPRRLAFSLLVKRELTKVGW